MSLPVVHTFRTFLAALCLGGVITAQDTHLAAFGNPTGTPFQENSAVNEHIFFVGVQSGGFIDAISVGFQDRQHHMTRSSATHGGTSGVPAAFYAPLNDYLWRVEVWSDSGFIRGLALRTRQGYRQMYGYATGASRTFQAGSTDEIVGLHGTYASGLLTSLGVITRPVLATSTLFGTPCGLQYIRFRAGAERLRIGSSGVVEIVNVPAGLLGIMVIGLSTTSAGALTLPFDLGPVGAPSCTAYVSTDSIMFLGRDPNGIAGHTVLVPNNNALVGMQVAFQGYVAAGNNAANLSASNAMKCTVGVL